MKLFRVAALAVLPVLLGAGASGPTLYDPRQAYLSVEQKGVILIDVEQARGDPAAQVWAWVPADSPQIAPAHRRWFNGYNDCKPVLDGSAILVTSSWAGGVALIRRADKACLFYASAPAAHSAEMIGADLIAVATSSDKGELRFYVLPADPAAAALQERPAWSMPLPWGHGAVWDGRRRVLYALGGAELLKLRVVRAAPGAATTQPVAAEVLGRWKLPKPSGHDLLFYDAGHLSVTVGEGAYLFDLEKESFAPLRDLADQHDLKSVGRNSATGQIMYTQAQPKSSHTNKIEWVGADDLVLPYKLIYKARWNAPPADGR